ncbi:MAG: DUF262 domain-containing protein [Dehalococcoidia bacterium]
MGSQMKIYELISEIKRGDLILPEFQRGYVWNKSQVREYLTSLYRGYPTGSFLIWKTPNPGMVRGGDASNGGAFQLILDGQQRLTSIYTLIEGEPPPFYEGEKLFFDLYFNVETEEFKYYSRIAMRGQPEWVPVTAFLKAGLGDYLKKDGPLTAEERDFLFDFHDRLNQLDSIKSYNYYLEVLGEREMDEVVRIFNLVNKQGTPLDKADLALSHVCSVWPEARGVLRNAKADLAAVDYDIELSLLVRMLAAVATGSGRLEPIYSVQADALKEAWHLTRKSLDYLVSVLRADAHMPTSGHVTSHNVLIPLVVHLSRNNCRFSSEIEKRRFLYWMYAALMWNRYSGPTETRVTQDIAALSDPEPTRRLLDSIVADRGRLRVEGRDLVGASTRTAWASIAYVVARSRRARDWIHGAQLGGSHIGKDSPLEYHHIFPQSLLYAPQGKYNSNFAADRQRVNEIANIVFLTAGSNKVIGNRPPSEYLPEQEAKFPGILDEQSIPKNAELWKLDRFEEFLAARRDLLARAINEFMDSLAVEGHASPAPTIADYVAAGESETVEFKGSLRWDHRTHGVNKELTKAVVKTIAAFMNSKGGTLVVGVSDSGEAWGIEHDFPTLGAHKDQDGWQEALVSALASTIGEANAALVDCSFADYQGKTVAIVRADPWHKPVYVESDSGTEFYIRAGNTTRRLSPKEAVEYVATRFRAAQ